MKCEVVLAGSGGQGVALAGLMLAEAAAVHDGKNVAQAPSYGVEARGGWARSDLVISDEAIDFPHVVQADVLLAWSQDACDALLPVLKESGTLIIDSDHVHCERPFCAFPIARMAEEATGWGMAANVVALGILVGVTGIVSRPAIDASVRVRSPAGTADANARALLAGLEATARMKATNVSLKAC